MSYHVTPAPYATFSSSASQYVADAAASQAVTYNTTTIANGIMLVNGSKITLPQKGNYALSFSAIGHNKGTGNPLWVNLFLKKNNNLVDNSSTIVVVTKQQPNTIVATFDVECTNPGDFYEIFLAGQTADCGILATPAQAAVPLTSPAMPACPSIITVVWQIS